MSQTKVNDAVIVDFALGPEVCRVAGITEDGRAMVFRGGNYRSDVKVERSAGEWPIVGTFYKKKNSFWDAGPRNVWVFVPGDDAGIDSEVELCL